MIYWKTSYKNKQTKKTAVADSLRCLYYYNDHVPEQTGKSTQNRDHVSEKEEIHLYGKTDERKQAHWPMRGQFI